MAYSEEQRKTFENEIGLLRKVDHPNIIRLIAHWINEPYCSLIMEYADCGNLYDLLHNTTVKYNARHALSWSHQTALALAYLHNLKPRPLVHRDVKPPNLLLLNSCLTLKICDFGTACDVHTHMTTNQGSAAWMAPEVFNNQFNSYTEKCDTYSFGVTLWEIFSRKKPFAELATSFTIMWTVSTGQRPPLLQSCPQPLEELITMCWEQEPDNRPSMSQVEKRLKQMTDLIMDGKEVEPIVLPVKTERPPVISSFSSLTESLPFGTATEPANGNTDLYSFLMAPRYPQDMINTEPGGSQENLLDAVRYRRPSNDRNLDVPRPGPSAEPPQLPERSERRRSNSFNNMTSASLNPPVADASVSRHKSTNDNSVTYDDVPNPFDNSSPRHRIPGRNVSQDGGYGTSRPGLHSFQVYVAQIDAKYRPLQPDSSNNTSMGIFKEHQEVCSKFNRLNTENKLLVEREKEIEQMEERGVPNFDLGNELSHAIADKRSLSMFADNLKKQLEKIKREKLRQEAAKDGFDLVG